MSTFLQRRPEAPQGGILSLDLASKSGWCYGPDGLLYSPAVVEPTMPNQPVWGVWQLPSPTIAGRQAVAFENELLDAIDQYQPKLVVYEASLPAGAQSHARTAELLIGLGVVTDMACYRHEIDVRKEYPQTVRAKIMGPGNGRITSKQKNEGFIVRWLQARGYQVEDHNAADALLQWLYAAKVRATA